MVFPQALTINGFTGAVMGATLGPALIGEWLRHALPRNSALLGARLTDFNPDSSGMPLSGLFGMVQRQALVVTIKEIYGWLLIAGIFSLLMILLSYSPIRPAAILPKWSSIRRIIKRLVRSERSISLQD